MTPPTDSLEAALRAVPLVCRDCGEPATDARPLVCSVMSLHDSVADYAALAAAARKWVKENMPMPFESRPSVWWDAGSRYAGYNRALADVAKALGLEL